MKDLVFDSLLSVGVDEIDEDHRKLVDLFNIFNQSVTEGAATDYLIAVLEELVNCTVWHFSHEERLMLKYGYKGFKEHKAEHEELIRNVRKIQHIVQAEKPVSTEDVEFLRKWLTGHILSTDMKLGSYLLDVM